MPVERIEYKDDKYDVVLTVRQATVIDGMNRSVLVSKMYALAPTRDGASEVEQFQRVVLIQTYPACLAATDIESSGEVELTTSITPEDFLLLPEVLFKQWEEAVFRLNEHWIFRRTSSAEGDTEGEASEPNEESN